MSKNKGVPIKPAPEVKEEPKVEATKIEEPTQVDAIVDGVNSMLNVRSTPEKKDGNVITTIKKGTKIKVVDPKKAKNEWYKIIVVDSKQVGFAMKRYIKII